LKYTTQIHVKSRGRAKGKKITGIENSPIEDQVLISSNDSRLRLYHLNDRSLSCKYRGNTNMCSQIRASYRDDGKYIICGSEDHRVYIWNADIQNSDKDKDTNNGFFTAFRRDRNECYESFEAHSNVVTCAIFAPTATKKILEEKHIRSSILSHDSSTEGDIIITADYTGVIRIFENDRIRPKSSGSLGKASGLEVLHSQEDQLNDGIHTHKRAGSTSSANSVSSSGSNISSNPAKMNPFQKKDEKKEDTCPSCGGKNTKTFGMVDEQKKKKKDEFKACLDCDITWKVS